MLEKELNFFAVDDFNIADEASVPSVKQLEVD